MRWKLFESNLELKTIEKRVWGEKPFKNDLKVKIEFEDKNNWKSYLRWKIIEHWIWCENYWESKLELENNRKASLRWKKLRIEFEEENYWKSSLVWKLIENRFWMKNYLKLSLRWEMIEKRVCGVNFWESKFDVKTIGNRVWGGK